MCSAPRLIPIFGHRYLLAEPDQSSNPILSIHQADGIVDGANLRQYLLIELADVLGIQRPDREAVAAETTVSRETMPFWGDLFN